MARKNTTKQKVRAIDLLMELKSFVTVTDQELEQALAKPVDEDNREFARLVRDWKFGLYDEDPEVLRHNILRLCK
jgi:hypothetical protein